MPKFTLKGARVNAGYSQKTVAKLMKKGEQTICNWERGKTRISAEDLKKLCGIYGLKQDDINLPCT